MFWFIRYFRKNERIIKEYNHKQEVMNICVYYEGQNKSIIDIIPHDLEEKQKANIAKFWQQPIMQKILIALSEGKTMTLSMLAEELGHSPSTIHDAIKRLEEAELISTEISYKKKKQRIIRSHVLFVTKSPKFKEALAKFFQGLWVDSQDTNAIITFLKENSNNRYSAEEISAALHIPVDRVELALSNWDSIITRGLSQINKEVPFTKRITYQSK